MNFDFLKHLEQIGEAQMNAALGQQMIIREIHFHLSKLVSRGQAWVKSKLEPKPFQNPWV